MKYKVHPSVDSEEVLEFEREEKVGCNFLEDCCKSEGTREIIGA